MKTLREILERIYRDGLDGALSSEEYSFDQALKEIDTYYKSRVPSVEEIRRIIQIITEKHFAPITIGYKEDLAQAIADFHKEE
ncbi:hypothetical protein LCGC14_2377890 [marine sediment metagenome]|uniref:Uncharacterized protein n=1 Tax=marine sediment metagenome TaxID=412755 RepID=A0A0F9C1T2_9ZZZZ